MYAVLYRTLFALLTAFAISAALGPFLIPVLERLQGRTAGQKLRRGAVTMGGVLLLAAVVLSSLLWGRDSYYELLPALLLCAVMGVFGFADDFVRLSRRDGTGLHWLQRLLVQAVVALLFSLWFYFEPAIGSAMWPNALQMGIAFIPFAMLVLIASFNAVSLTDGMDGLCASVSSVYEFAMAALLCVAVITAQGGSDPNALLDQSAMAVFSAAAAGACLGFLLFNASPARIRLGSTGSYLLGGAVGATALLSRTALLLPLMGVCFATSAATALLHKAFTRFRNGGSPFLASPLHRHLAARGTPESKIVSLYTLVTAVASAAALLLYWFFH